MAGFFAYTLLGRRHEVWESIAYRVMGTGNGQMTRSYRLRLKRIELLDPRSGHQYWLYSRRVGRDAELVRVPAIRGEEVWDAASDLQLTFPADGQWSIGGGYDRELVFDSHDNYCKFRWRNDLPAQWRGLDPVLDRLEALRDRACLHLRPVSEEWESLREIIADGDRTIWNRIAKVICAFRRTHGAWPTILHVPETSEASLKLAIGSRTYAELRKRLNLVPDPELDWGRFERLVAEDESGRRAEYPVDTGDVFWQNDEEFHFWIGITPEAEAEPVAPDSVVDLDQWNQLLFHDLRGEYAEW